MPGNDCSALAQNNIHQYVVYDLGGDIDQQDLAVDNDPLIA